MTQCGATARVVARVALLMRMIKFSHTVFALPFAVMAAMLAAQAAGRRFPVGGKLVLVLLCMVGARTVAMTFNRIVDAAIDARNPRTADRALPRGRVTAGEAWLLLVAAAVLFEAAAYGFWHSWGPWFGYGNPWPLIFSLPVLVFISAYSYTKRFTWASHFWLGASLMLAPIGAWVAVSPPDGPLLDLPVLLLAGAVLLWTAGFDIIYALQDHDFDRRSGLHSVPARFGVNGALWLSRLCHSLSYTALLGVALTARLGGYYFAALVLAGGLLVTEHVLVRGGRQRHLPLAFATLNGLVSMVLGLGLALDVALS